MAQDLVVVGQVTRSHGVRGEVKVRTFTESAASFDLYDQLFIRLKNGADKLFNVTEVRPHKNSLLMKLEGVQSKEDADELTGCDILVPRERLPELDEDEFYWTDLIGLTVYMRGGEQLGKVVHIFWSGADDILMVKDQSREYLLPFRSEVVIEVDIEQGRIVVDPPAELLEA